VKPQATEEIAGWICERLQEYARDGHLGERDLWFRHLSNINAGLDVILADWEIIQGYLYAAHAEIKALFDKKEREHEGSECETA
jgi:hypothetical protein